MKRRSAPAGRAAGKDKRRSRPLCSMTGMGAGRAENRDVAIEVDLKGTNGRFLDINFRLPRGLARFESDMRSVLSRRLSRGRIDVVVARSPKQAAAVGVEFRRPVYDALLGVGLAQLKAAGVSDPAAKAALVRDLLSRREVLDVVEAVQDSSRERKVLLEALESALDALVTMREAEGSTLAADLSARRVKLAQLAKEIERIRAGAPQRYRDRVLAGVQALAPDVRVDEGRLAAEVAYLADRSDIAEELTRIASHLAQMETIISRPPCGKQLDFATQELAREFNTIGSKAQDAAIQATVVEAKAEIERIREQVQNIE